MYLRPDIPETIILGEFNKEHVWIRIRDFKNS